MCTDHAPAAALLQVARSAVVRAEIKDRAVTGFHGRAGNFETLRFFIPVRRVGVGLPLHAVLGEEINALEVLIHFVGSQYKTQGRVFGHIIQRHPDITDLRT